MKDRQKDRQKIELFTNPSSMEPLFPEDRGGAVEALVLELLARTAQLQKFIHPVTLAPVKELLREMNSYYSNLIEGHSTHPLSIRQALRKSFSKDSKQHALQIESLAHIEVQRLIEHRLTHEPDLDISSADFFRYIHREFYKRMPPEFHFVEGTAGKRVKIQGGELRKRSVSVGNHIAPAHEKLPAFLARFQEAYSPQALAGTRKIAAIAASHHRLAWIHPFLDGNGRVVRLFSDAYLHRAGLGGLGLWTLSRGLARSRERYYENLSAADQPRRGDLDGRGNLSSQGLEKFCRYFLETSIDQVRFMLEQLELEAIEKRIQAYVEIKSEIGQLRREAFYILRETWLRGEIPRGEAARITGLPERTARVALKQLLDLELLQSSTPKGPVTLDLPPEAAAYYFPRLYPEAIELELRARARLKMP